MSKEVVELSRGCVVAPMQRQDAGEAGEGVHLFEATLSSDFERPIYGQLEVLSHEAGAVDLSIVEEGRAFLQADGHYSDVGIGRIEPGTVRLEGGTLRASLRIVDDDNGPGHHAIARVRGEVARAVSIDYEWLDWKLRKRESDSAELIDVSRWRLRGVSLVTDPADASAAIGEKKMARARNAIETEKKARRMIREEAEPAEKETEGRAEDDPEGMDEDADRKDEEKEEREAASTSATSDPEARSGDRSQPRTRSPDIFNESMAAIRAEHDSAMKAAGERELPADLLDGIANLRANAEGRVRHGHAHEGGTLQVAILQRLASAPDTSGVRLSKEFRRGADGQIERDASHSPLLHAMADAERRSGLSVDQLYKGMRDVGFGNRTYEAGAVIEMGDGARSAMNGDAAEVFSGGVVPVPLTVWMRSLADTERDREISRRMRGFSVGVGGDTKGGELVDTNVLVKEWVDNLYASAMLREVGARQMPGLSSNVTIPRVTAKITPAFASENGQLALDDFTIAGTTTAPHRIGVAFDITHQLNMQTGGAADRIVMDVMMSSSMEEIDKQCITGNGQGDNVAGLKTVAGVANTALANLGTATSQQLHTWLITAIQAPRTRDVPQPQAMLMSEGLVSHLRDSARPGGGGDGFIFEDGRLNGMGEIPISRTTMLALAAGEEAFFVGHWKNFVLVEYGAPLMIQDSLTRAREGEKRTTMQRWIDVIDTRVADLQAGVTTAV